MAKSANGIKSWVAPLAAISSVILTAGFALTRKLDASEKIRELASLGTTLNDTAMSVQAGTLSRRQAEELKNKQDDLNRRMEDSARPALAQAQLMETARKVGLDVQEVTPTSSDGRPGEPKGKEALPCYRISVRGSYQQIAEYLESAESKRLPMRVRQFRLGRKPVAGSGATTALSAEVVMEGFRPPAQPGAPKDKG